MTTIFDNPANDMEKDIAEHIKPLVTAEVEEKIKKDKLTLKGCCKFCMDNGKNRNCGGIAYPRRASLEMGSRVFRNKGQGRYSNRRQCSHNRNKAQSRS